MLRLVGFDLDGTLIDSAPDLSDALGQALLAVGLSAPTEAQTRGWVGDGIETLISRAIEDQSGLPPSGSRLGDALAAFDEYYRRHSFERSRLYPNVRSTIRNLNRSGLVCLCITNKRSEFAVPMLAAAGLDSLLVQVYGGDSLARKKPFPDQLIAAMADHQVAPEQAVMVGDSPNDMDAAAAAGWRFVYARYGYTAAMRARQVEPEPAIDSMEDLSAVLNLSADSA